MNFELDPWKSCRINGLGDVPLTHMNDNEISIQHITNYYAQIDAAGTRPVSVGGDHFVTVDILQALGGTQSKLTSGEPVYILYFDAHTACFSHMKHFLRTKNQQFIGPDI